MENKNSNNLSHIYLEFNGKLPSDVFQNEVFFRVANLHKKNPLVQVNDTLFKGTYDHSMGTNLFLEETDVNSRTLNPFEKQTSICLKYLQSSTKLLNLQQVKIPQKKVRIENEVKNINYNLNMDYNELLKKFENGTLQIGDILSKESPQEMLSQKMEVVEDETDDQNEHFQNNEFIVQPESESELEKQLENTLENVRPSNMLEKQYDQLNILARRPVRRAVSPELVAECNEKYKDAADYHNIERQILQVRDGFKSEVINVEEDTLSSCIDIDRCVLFGLIPESSNFPRILTKEEKNKLLTLENFENLSLAARYYVLQNLVNDLQQYVNNATRKSLHEKDEYGRTSIQTLEIYKKLTTAVKNRLQDIKTSLESNYTR